MNDADITQRIEELATVAGIDLKSERITEDRCWVDGRARCPYGLPRGQYLLRPQQSCHALWESGNSGCAVYHDNVADQELPERVQAENVREFFEDQKVTMADELRRKASDLPAYKPDRFALTLAADLLELRKLNTNILTEDVLPPEPKSE